MSSKVETIHPMIVSGIKRYQELLLKNPESDILLDEVFWGVELSSELLSFYFRQLLVIEREHRKNLKINTDFESYWERKWFQSYIDELVAVLIEKEYVLEERLGKGGQGRVYRVRNKSVHNRQEALKIFLPVEPAFIYNFAQDDYLRLLKRFQRESQTLCRLQNEHLPRVYSVRSISGLRFFTMEYIVGASLSKILQQQGSLDTTLAAKLICTAASTLVSLHENDIFHRDVKPSNLIFDKNQRLYLVDFGLVKFSGNSLGETSLEVKTITGRQGHGSMGYVAPEQLINASTVTSAADIYSLGATFYHLLMGSTLPANNLFDQIDFLPHIPKELQNICCSCLKMNPEERPKAAEVASLLKKWLDWSTLSNQAIRSKLNRRKWVIRCSVGIAAFGTGIFFYTSLQNRYRIDEILSTLKSHREQLREILSQAKLPDHWMKPGFDPAIPLYKDVTILSQANYALLTINDLTDSELEGCYQSLCQPFLTEQTDPSIFLKDYSDKKVGFSMRNQIDHTQCHPLLWYIAAFAALLRQSKNRLSSAKLENIKNYYHQLLQISKQYLPGNGDNWKYYANQLFPNPDSLDTAALAVFVLLEAKKAGLPWWGLGGEGNLTIVLDSTLSFIKKSYLANEKPHWHARLDKSPSPVDWELTFFIYHVMIEAKIQAEISSLISPTFIAQMLTELQSYLLSPPQDLGNYLTFRAEAENLKGAKQTFEDSELLFWYPIILRFSSSLFKLLPKNSSESKTVINIIGNLQFKLYPNIIKMIETKGQFTSHYAEILMACNQAIESIS